MVKHFATALICKTITCYNTWLVHLPPVLDLVLAQQKVAEKSNEITAIPLLLKLLNLKGNIITIDAMEHKK